MPPESSSSPWGGRQAAVADGSADARRSWRHRWPSSRPAGEDWRRGISNLASAPWRSGSVSRAPPRSACCLGGDRLGDLWASSWDHPAGFAEGDVSADANFPQLAIMQILPLGKVAGCGRVDPAAGRALLPAFLPHTPIQSRLPNAVALQKLPHIQCARLIIGPDVLPTLGSQAGGRPKPIVRDVLTQSKAPRSRNRAGVFVRH